jgi:hypothetical protein
MPAMPRLTRWLLVALALTVSSCDHYPVDGAPQLAPAATSGSATPPTPPLGTPTVTPAAMACAPVTIAEPLAVVERLRTPGGCAAPERALAYRCDPGVDPVIALDPGGPATRYLGGRFAVRVPAVPDGAAEVGVTSAGRVWSLPGDPQPTVFVEGTTGAERWLPLPVRGAVPAPPAATVIGDSLLDGAQEELVAALPAWVLSIDAEVGRSSFGAATIAEAWPDPAPPVVVVQIAVNDHDPAAMRANVARIAEASDHPQLLLWLTGHGPDEDTDDVNRAIEEAIGLVARGAILDWDRLVPEDALDPDGVHLLGDRQGELADVIARWLRAWHDAATGSGATGCEDAVRAAARHVDA